MDGRKYGIEAEYALLRPNGRFADFTNTSYAEIRPLLETLPDYGHPELRVGDAGIRVKNWYAEGDERFDENGRSTGLAFKGIEIRTPVCASIEESIGSLDTLRALLRDTLHAHGWSFLAIGFNPCTAAYAPAYAPWERDFHASHAANALPEVSTLSYGPDFNFSCSRDTPEAVIESVRRLTFYSPFIVPFSFSSPIVGGRLWEGHSYRTFRRTGPRPAALAHLAGAIDHPLAKQADPPSQHLRIEFKAFDMVGDDRLLAELFDLVVGIARSDSRDLPGTADAPDAALHRKAALTGFEDDAIREGAAAVLAASGSRHSFPLLREMLATRRTPAHAMRERFLRTGLPFGPLDAEWIS